MGKKIFLQKQRWAKIRNSQSNRRYNDFANYRLFYSVKCAGDKTRKAEELIVSAGDELTFGPNDFFNGLKA